MALWLLGFLCMKPASLTPLLLLCANIAAATPLTLLSIDHALSASYRATRYEWYEPKIRYDEAQTDNIERSGTSPSFTGTARSSASGDPTGAGVSQQYLYDDGTLEFVGYASAIALSDVVQQLSANAISRFRMTFNVAERVAYSLSGAESMLWGYSGMIDWNVSLVSDSGVTLFSDSSPVPWRGTVSFASVGYLDPGTYTLTCDQSVTMRHEWWPHHDIDLKQLLRFSAEPVPDAGGSVGLFLLAAMLLIGVAGRSRRH